MRKPRWSQKTGHSLGTKRDEQENKWLNLIERTRDARHFLLKKDSSKMLWLLHQKYPCYDGFSERLETERCFKKSLHLASTDWTKSTKEALNETRLLNQLSATQSSYLYLPWLWELWRDGICGGRLLSMEQQRDTTFGNTGFPSFFHHLSKVDQPSGLMFSWARCSGEFCIRNPEMPRRFDSFRGSNRSARGGPKVSSQRPKDHKTWFTPRGAKKAILRGQNAGVNWLLF